MHDQSKVMKVTVAEISAIETGRKSASEDYVASFVHWLKLEPGDQAILARFAKRSQNVVPFPPRPFNPSSKSIRFFRKLSKMSPVEIRNFATERGRDDPATT
jgi:hypothetical protein